MSEAEEEFYEYEMRDRGYGFCPVCGTPLSNWGAASHGDGDIYDEIACDQCGEVIREIHASYCQCPDCKPYLNDLDDESP